MFYFGFKELGSGLGARNRSPKSPFMRTGTTRIRFMFLEPGPELQESNSCCWSQNRKCKDPLHVYGVRTKMQGSNSICWNQNRKHKEPIHVAGERTGNARICFMLMELEPEMHGSVSCCWNQNRKCKDPLHVAWCQNRKRKDLHHVSGAKS